MARPSLAGFLRYTCQVMKQSLQLKLRQNLTISPQLQQAVKLLQLSSLELGMEIQEALNSNMMLELDEGEWMENPERDGEAPVATQSSEDEYPIPVENNTIPQDLPVDTAWEDIYGGAVSYPRNNEGAEYNSYENRDTGKQTLHGHLLWQLNLSPVSETDKAIAMALIDSLDDDGYLTTTLEEIQSLLSDEPPVALEEINAVLRMIQAMEPTGVGARNLAECLTLQLAQLAADTPWLNEARQLIDQHIHLLGAHDYRQIRQRMKLEGDELQQVIGLIQSMNPRPGNQVHESHTEYVVADVFVKKANGAWKVQLNTEAVPPLRINSGYARMIGRANNSDDNTSLKNHLQEARWFIKSLQSRSETLLRVATSIVERQRAFLEYGDEAMKPLVLHDIAEALGLHESTISRVTTKKYMHTPRGIFELKYFFSSHVGTDYGGTCSSTAIRALIKKLVQAEKPEKPLSDSKITTLLSARGINIARRTIAKYRESLSIPPSNERKRLI